MPIRRLLQILPVLILGLWSSSVSAQLNIVNAANSGNWADYYVQEILLGGGVVAFNAVFTGAQAPNPVGSDSLQIGEFTQSGTNIGMDYGVVLSSGDCENAMGAASLMAAGNPGATDNMVDSDLVILTGTSTQNNIAILEFDFIPQGDTVKFNYVFGSDEYETYVCSPFNDVFGFFLSGPGINGPFTNDAENLAVVPGSGAYVAINTINNVAGGSSCSGNPCPCNSAYYVDNEENGDTNIRYNGMTVLLQAVSPVICGDTYHIKMVIADIGDGFLDSGVFLEGGSFKSNLIEVNIASVNGDSTINEGCGTAEIRFVRADTSDTSISLIQFVGTATNGVDFDLIPDSIILLPGQFDSIIVINPFYDGLNEGMEYVTIQAISVSVCGDTFISEGTLYFFDVPDLHLNSTPDTSFDCPIDSLTIWTQVQGGGPPPYLYVWNTGDTGDVVTVPISQDFGVDTFIVEVWDSCFLFSDFDTVLVTRNYGGPPELDITNDSLVNCLGDSLQLIAGINEGNAPFDLLWSTSDTVTSINVVVNGPTTIWLSLVDACGRITSDTTTLGVKSPDNFVVSMPDSLIFCVGSNLSISPGVSGGISPYNFEWALNPTVFDDPLSNTFLIQQDTLLTLWVQDDCGSTTSGNTWVDAIVTQPFRASLASDAGECAGDSFLLVPKVTGGLRPLQYQWSTSDTDTAIVLTANVSQQIIVTVSDVCGHVDTAGAYISIPVFGPIEMLVSGDAELCYGEEYRIYVTPTGGAGEYTIKWEWQNDVRPTERYEQVGDGEFIVLAQQSNSHYIIVNDQCGNTAIDTVRVTVEHCLVVPNVVTPNEDGLNDAFYINNITSFADAHLRVYNRWGEKVFEAMPYLNNWVPKREPEGTYYYILESSEFPQMRGSLTVLKND